MCLLGRDLGNARYLSGAWAFTPHSSCGCSFAERELQNTTFCSGVSKRQRQHKQCGRQGYPDRPRARFHDVTQSGPPTRPQRQDKDKMSNERATGADPPQNGQSHLKSGAGRNNPGEPDTYHSPRLGRDSRLRGNVQCVTREPSTKQALRHHWAA